MDGAVQMIGVGKGLMGQEVAFEVAPGSLDIVQLRGIFGQPFEGEPMPLGERGTGSFAGMDRAVVENKGDGFLRASWARPVNRVEAAQSGDEVGAAFGGAGIDDQLVGGTVEKAEQRPLARLAGRLDPQIGAAPGPGAGEIGVRESLRLVAVQQDNIAGPGLLSEQAQAQTRAIDRLGVLPARQGMARPAPGEAPFFITTLRRDGDKRCPVRCSIASARRGKVQFGRSDTAGANNSSITLNAAAALTGARPGALRARNPAVPSRPKIQRQCRTLSGCTQNAAAMRSLVHPATDSSIARARSASSRSAEPASARNSSRCAAVTEIHDRLGMFPYMQ